MFRTFLLILFLCGLSVLSVLLTDKASTQTYACPPQTVCQFETPRRVNLSVRTRTRETDARTTPQRSENMFLRKYWIPITVFLKEALRC